VARLISRVTIRARQIALQLCIATYAFVIVFTGTVFGIAVLRLLARVVLLAAKHANLFVAINIAARAAGIRIFC
jgi:hypothetical protein